MCARTLLEASSQFAVLRDAILPMGRAFSGLAWAADADSRAAYLTELRVLRSLACSALANTLSLAEACAAGAAELPSAAEAVGPKAEELRQLAAELMSRANALEGYPDAPPPADVKVSTPHGPLSRYAGAHASDDRLRKPPRHVFDGLYPLA